MISARILLLAGLFGLAFGQNYHIRNDGVYDGPAVSPVYARAFNGNRVTMCYTGNTIYIADGVLGNPSSTTIIRLPTDTFIATTFDTVPGQANTALACCCNYIAYGYQDSGIYKIRVQRTDTTGVDREYTVARPSVSIAAISLDCITQTLQVVTMAELFTFNLVSPSNVPVETTFANALVAAPRCVAFITNGAIDYVVAAFEDRDVFQLVNINDRSTEQFSITLSNKLKIGCLTVDGTNLNLFGRDSSGARGYLITVPFNSVTGAPTMELTTGTTGLTEQNFQLNSIGEFVNGLSVCATCFGDACLASTGACASCDEDPTFSQCGFCSPVEDVCICENPAQAGCIYDDPAVSMSCERPTPRLDASCVVLNPVAERRRGNANGIALVISPSEAVGVISTQIRRAARTGRWPTGLLPKWQDLLAGGQLLAGRETMVQANARGRRFGIFDGQIDRDDAISEDIFCITTEKSAFTNRVFSYVAVEGGSVTLEADLTNPHVTQVRWRHTSLAVPGQITDFPGSDGSLSLTINPVIKANHEGVYEVYRSRRYLRTWHPIIHLYVRSCQLGVWGTGCTGTCPTCTNGICDVATGQCRCYPGFRGTMCESTCTDANQIGQNCDIDCNNIFSGAAGTDCINLEICSGDELGCHCRSGLIQPECTLACPADTWGPDCKYSCDGCVGCVPRTGCPAA